MDDIVTRIPMQSLNGNPIKSVEFSRWTCAELAEQDFPIEYLIEDFLVAGQPAIIAGPKKCLKTTTIVAAAIALATGTPLFGRFAVLKPQRVLMMTAESGMATMKETISRIAATQDIALKAIANLIVSDMVPKLANDEHLRGLERMLDDDGIGVLFVDPAYMAMPGTDPANGFTAYDVLSRVSRLCGDRSVTLVLAHHTRKSASSTTAPPDLDDIAWAGYGEWARQWILLGRRERYTPGSGQHRLWLTVGGSAGHSGEWALDVNEGPYRRGAARQWSVSLQEADEARSQRAAERVENKSKIS